MVIVPLAGTLARVFGSSTPAAVSVVSVTAVPTSVMPSLTWKVTIPEVTGAPPSVTVTVAVRVTFCAAALNGVDWGSTVVVVAASPASTAGAIARARIRVVRRIDGVSLRAGTGMWRAMGVSHRPRGRHSGRDGSLRAGV